MDKVPNGGDCECECDCAPQRGGRVASRRASRGIDGKDALF